VSGPLAFCDEFGVNRENPWVGLASFTEDQSGYFYGRDDEIAELFRLLKRETLTVLFSQSGLGKTSLLQAGLFPQIRQADFLPVYIRLLHGEDAPPLAAQVKAALAQKIDAGEVDAPKPGTSETLWEYFHRKDVDFWNTKQRLTMPVLVFDQFEEIFTLGRTEVARRTQSQAFLTELADLIENRPPAAVKDKMDRGDGEAGRFFFDQESCKVILSLREDYLPDLEGLRPLIRSITQNRMRIVRMNGAQAYQAVIKPGAALLEEGVAARIVEFVSGAKSNGEQDRFTSSAEPLAALQVEPALLSVVCRELNNKRRTLGLPKITLDLLAGSRSEIIAEFYERSVADLPPAARLFVENRLLTKSGYRDNVAVENAIAEDGIARDTIDRLVNRRLLRLEDRFGVQRVELTHDLLTQVIRVSRDSRQQREAAAALELARTRALQVKRRARIMVAVVIAVALLITTVISIAAAIAISEQKKSSYYKQFTVLRPLYAAWTPGSADRNILFACHLANELARKKNTIDPLLYGDIISLLDRSLDRRKRLVETCWNYEWPESREIVGDRYPVLAVAYSPDGQTLVIGDKYGRIRVLRGGVLGDPIPVRGGSIRSLAFSPDGTRVAIGNDHGFVSLFDPRESAIQQAILQLGYPDDANKQHTVWSCSWNEKGDLAASCQDGSVYVWSDLLSKLQSGDLHPSRRVENRVNDKLIPVHAVAWDSTSSMLAIGDGDGHLRIWNRSALSEPANAHAEAIWSLAWSRDGRLACASWDRSISMWKIEISAQSVVLSPLNRNRQAHDQRVRDLAWVDNDQTIASVGDDGMLKFWKASDLSDLGFSEQSPEPQIWKLSYRGDKKEIATANNDGSVRIYEVYPPQQKTHGNHLNDVICLAFNGAKILSFDADGLLNTFDSFSWTEEQPVQIPVDFQSDIQCARFQPKINAFVIGYAHSACKPYCGQLVVWDPHQPSPIKSCGLGEKVSYIDCHPQEAIVAFITSAGTLGLRTLPDLLPVASQPDLPVMEQSDRLNVRRLAWSNAGDLLLVALNHRDDNKSEILTFHFDLGLRRLNRLTSIDLPCVIASVSWHPRDNVIAIGTGGGAIILQYLPGDQTKPVFGHDGTVTALSWSRDGRQLFTGGEDGGVKVWDFDPDGQNPLTLTISLRQDTGGIRVIGVDPEGSGIYTGGTLPRILYWPAELYSAETILERARRMVHRNMFTAEWARYVAGDERQSNVYEKTFNDLPALPESQ
jgi:WD40 repeat protein